MVSRQKNKELVFLEIYLIFVKVFFVSQTRVQVSVNAFLRDILCYV